MTTSQKRLLAIWGTLTLVCLYGVLFYPYRTLLPSGDSLAMPSMVHWLGTDDLGVDVFAQISHGYFSSLSVGIGSALLSFLLGGTVGVLAGWRGGAWDAFLSFWSNFFLALPQLPLMVIVGVFLGESRWNLILVVTVFSWAPIAKIMRARTKTLCKTGYVRQAKCYGASAWYLFYHHLLGQLLPLLAVQSLFVIGYAILQEASLAYLGVSDPLATSWGLMIRKCTSFQGIYHTDYWLWWLLPPACLLVVTVLCVRLLAKELEHTVQSKYL